ncbi:GNAT family N-acetyltransferase [Paenibacillus montanisoli]|uniref:GNAT family N-acetyltransferase n=1 Tax=Paenibacillus montanisoli TaxID=2081970 RepID=A0A328TWR0_9BACL|nr:GNAT family N-acetyltransferase [Paenibacillus montanisoli]RAP73175.1 GNAT family N-acetyltransferase [Paenibacillus montanisoli]
MSKYVRWANEHDAEILTVLNHEFNGVELTADEVENSLSSTNELIALAILDDQPVGFACAQCFKSFCYRDSQGEITEMYIKETARRKGLATLLLSFLEEELRKRGATEIKVITGMNNAAALKTYERSKYVKKTYVVFQKKQ